MGVHTAYEPGDEVLIRATVNEIYITPNKEICCELKIINPDYMGERSIALYEWQIVGPAELLEGDA